MSDFTLIDILNLVRAEIARTEIGDTVKITGPAGERGPQGEAGPQGPQGPRGNDGQQGPAGIKGNQGKKGDKGVKGADGDDGVGIARIDQDSVDGSVVMYLTDGTSYTVEMPLIDSDGNLSREVHYKTGGSGGDGSSGTVDLSGYVRRPPSSLKDSWLVYKEGLDGSKSWTPVTTDLVAVNPNPFRNAKGQFIGTPEELEALKNQRDVNNFLYNAISDIETGDIDLEGYATEAQVEEVDRTSQMRDEALDAKIDQESNLNTVAHIKFEDQILRCYAWSEGDNESLERKLTKVDEGLQAQIDENKDESESGDRHLQGEIDQIALALETLLVQREHGQWKYVGFSGDTIPRNAGEFALISDDLSASDNIITLNQEDLEGKTHGFSDVEVGDYVEIVDLDEPANYVLFVVAEKPEGSGIVNVEVTLKDKGQNILVGETCEIRFFQVNEQDLQLDDLDARYLKKTGGNLTGGINMGTNPIMSVQYLGMTGAKCIQEAQTTRIKFDGKVTIAKAGTNKDGFVLKGATADGSDKDLLSVYHNDTGLDAVNYKGKQESSTNIATVGYVDNAVGNGAQSGSPMSAKLMVGFQVWSEGRLSEGCFNMLDENKQVTSKVKGVRFLTFHIIQGWDHCEWMSYALRGKGQIHLMDKDGKYLLSKFVMGAEKREAGSGDDPVDALWFFELEEYGFDVDVTLSGNYFMEFDSCLEQA